MDISAALNAYRLLPGLLVSIWSLGDGSDAREDGKCDIQNFICGVDFGTILAEARKYALALTVATQTLSQRSPETLSAVFGNCATIIGYRTSGRDAAALKEEFATLMSRRNLQDLPDYKAYVRTLSSSKDTPATPLEPKLLSIHPPIHTPGANTRERIIRTSLGRYAKPRAIVDAGINKFLAA